jgi:FkbM family methyltransferase
MSRSTIKNLFSGLRIALEKRSTASLFADGLPVLIYGAGNVGKDVFKLLTGRGISVAGFLDRQARSGSNWNGIPIQTPDEATLSAAQRRQTHVIIGVFNAYVEMPLLVLLLKNLGYGQVTDFLELHDQFAEELGDRYWLTARNYYCGKEEPAAAAHELWSDETSRDLYARVLRFRFFMDQAALPAPDQNRQYFPQDLPSWPSPLRFVDCGAFDGDTLRQIQASQIKTEAIAAFEPDQANFARLDRYVRTNAATMPTQTHLFPCGVGTTLAQVRFTSAEGGSHVSATGDTIIQCVALDETLPVFRPNLIKMDIEGAEYDALLGAAQLIAQHHPGLAICLYHRPDHLWEIPLLVRRLTGGGGKYFLRGHGFSGFDLVLYWLPD